MKKLESLISGSTKTIALFGWPVAHSLSPVMHNAAFAELALDFIYVALPMDPSRVKEGIEGFKALGLAGANVTIPHKEAVLPYLDRLTPVAQKMGTVNTLYWDNGELVGTTTDPHGALENLRQSGFVPDRQPLLIVGSGGAARALGFAFATELPRMPLTISFRSDDRLQAEKLADELTSKTDAMVELLPLLELPKRIDRYELLINATPVGMHPLQEQTPFLTETLLPEQWVYDIVYTPRQTKLLREAAAKGCKTVEGLGMLLHQGAKSFELWTGKAAPIEVMAVALERRG